MNEEIHKCVTCGNYFKAFKEELVLEGEEQRCRCNRCTVLFCQGLLSQIPFIFEKPTTQLHELHQIIG